MGSSPIFRIKKGSAFGWTLFYAEGDLNPGPSLRGAGALSAPKRARGSPTGASTIFRTKFYDFLREKSDFRARTPRSAEHVLAFGEAWSDTIIDFLMKINNLSLIIINRLYWINPVKTQCH